MRTPHFDGTTRHTAEGDRCAEKPLWGCASGQDCCLQRQAGSIKDERKRKATHNLKHNQTTLAETAAWQILPKKTADAIWGTRSHGSLCRSRCRS